MNLDNRQPADWLVSFGEKPANWYTSLLFKAIRRTQRDVGYQFADAVHVQPVGMDGYFYSAEERGVKRQIPVLTPGHKYYLCRPNQTISQPGLREMQRFLEAQIGVRYDKGGLSAVPIHAYLRFLPVQARRWLSKRFGKGGSEFCSSLWYRALWIAGMTLPPPLLDPAGGNPWERATPALADPRNGRMNCRIVAEA